ncbi:MAG: serine/threonine-protein kinase [Deltaproteobacteria bacterium]|nr:serine/threonine-protein kinase [Deltaproteobacteria bacterium]
MAHDDGDGSTTDARAVATTVAARPGEPSASVDALSLDSDLGALRAIAGMKALPPRPTLAICTALDGYVITSQLGAGGMGVVYLARDRQLGREVAIKLHARADDGDGTARLLREARAMATLTHPNVATIYEVGTHEGHLFIAMAYLDGGTARTWLAAQPRTWREIVALYIAAGRGLVAAHRAGMVHRDFKPDNVLLGKDGQVRVADFGLARLGTEAIAAHEAEDAEASTVTMTGVVLGTPLYMSPEQRRGKVGPAADQFAFCVALWEALAGAPPFAGATTGEIDEAVRAQRFQPPTAGRVVPAHLRKALSRGLAVDPEARFPSMEALLDALARDPARTRTRAALALVAVAAVGGGAYAMMSGSRTAPAPVVVAPVDPCAEDRLATLWTDQRKEAIEAALASQGPAGVDASHIIGATIQAYVDQWSASRNTTCKTAAGSERTRRLACFDGLVDRAGALFDVLQVPNRFGPRLAATAVNELPLPASCAGNAAPFPSPPDPTTARGAEAARALIDLGFARYAVNFGDKGLGPALAALVRADLLGWRPLQAEAHALFADILFNDRQAGAARSHYEVAYEHATASDHPAARAVAAAKLSMTQDDPAAAEIWTQRALALLERARPVTRLEVSTRNSYGGRLDDLGRSAEAIVQHQRALDVLTELRLDRDIAFAETLRFLAASQAKVGANAEAIRSYDRALLNLDQVHGPQSPTLLQPLVEFALLYLDVDRPGDALDKADRAIAIIGVILAQQHKLNPFQAEWHARSQAIRGHVLRVQGKRADAQAAIGAAIPWFDANPDPSDPQIAMLAADRKALGL